MGAEKTSLASAAKEPTANPAVVLLVEDEAVVRQITGQVLENAGYRVLESSSPDEALHVASRHQGKVDLLLTDVVMPGMNGIDLAYKLRDLQPDLVTVFMSGYAEDDLTRKMTATAAIHIQKPFTVNFLLSRIAEALETRARHGLDRAAIARSEHAAAAELHVPSVRRAPDWGLG